MPFCVGLTGGIGSGKSLVADLFQALGVPVLDADQVGRELVLPGSPGLAAITQAFGAGFIRSDGSLDRARMRAHIFGDEARRRQLEALLHPLIQQHLRDWRDAQTAPYCILSAAILLETGFAQLVQRVLVVDVAEEVQISRVLARDGIPRELAQQMLAAQLPRAARLARADDVLDNSRSPAEATQQVERLHARYLHLARAP